MNPERVCCNGCGAMLDITSTTNFVTCGVCHSRLTVRRTGTAVFTESLSGPTPRGGDTAPPPPDRPRPAGRPASTLPTDADTLQELQRQQEINRLENELNRLDINWEREKESYKVSGRYGHRYLPSKGSSVGQGVVFAVFGTFWTVFVFGITTGFTWSLEGRGSGAPCMFDMLFPLFGIVFVVYGVASSVNAYRKADEYEQAEQRYLNRKDQLRRQIGDLRRGR